MEENPSLAPFKQGTEIQIQINHWLAPNGKRSWLQRTGAKTNAGGTPLACFLNNFDVIQIPINLYLTEFFR